MVALVKSALLSLTTEMKKVAMSLWTVRCSLLTVTAML